jgi:hypothetical protein
MRKRAIEDIDQLRKDNIPTPVIIWKIAQKFGFNKKIVLERLQNCEEVAEIKEKNDKKPII